MLYELHRSGLAQASPRRRALPPRLAQAWPKLRPGLPSLAPAGLAKPSLSLPSPTPSPSLPKPSLSLASPTPSNGVLALLKGLAQASPSPRPSLAQASPSHAQACRASRGTPELPQTAAPPENHQKVKTCSGKGQLRSYPTIQEC